MSTPSLRRRKSRIARLLVAVLCAFAVVPTVAERCLAAELAEQAQSLRLVPEDAAFYSATLRLSEQVNIFLDSEAYSKLLAIPLFQFAKMQIEFQWQQASLPQVRQLRDYVESPEGQEIVALLGEMFSDEIFVYGDEDITGMLQLLVELNSIQQTAALEAAAKDDEPADVMERRLRTFFEEQDVRVPTVVFGFRIEDAERARRQLDVVHSRLRDLLDEKQPELSARLQRDQVAGNEFLTLRLDGSMIPWDELRGEVDEEDLERFEAWRELIVEKTLVAALGVVDEFVLLSISSATDHLADLGEGSLLADHAGLERLQQHADERVVSLSYVSEALNANLRSPQKTMEDLAGTAEALLQQAEVDEEQRELLVEDIRELDLSKYMPEAGEVTTISFLTDRGYEGYRYETGPKPMMDSSEPLTILDHLGGSPVVFIASRSDDSVEDYNEAVAWLVDTAQHVEQIVESKVAPEQWAEYRKYRERIVDLLRRIDRTNRELLYPALAENQGAVVLDLAASSEQWFEQMPKSPQPLPMLELAIVVTVSDAEKLRQGVQEYIAVIRDAMDLLRELNPEVPKFQLPEAERQELAEGGAIYRFDLPTEWGVDDQVAPNAGITEDAAAVSFMPGTTERLLNATPLEIDTALDLDRPAARITHVKIAEAIGALRPWIDYGVGVATGTIKVEDDEDGAEEEEQSEPSPVMFQMGMVMPQVYQLLDVFSTIKSATSITYEEEGVWITHSETHLKDLE